jgi:chromate reductase, NAD(P)H dehydrogenase (quinone)
MRKATMLDNNLGPAREANMIRILALSGSSRRGSLNQKLLDQAALGARATGCEVTSIRLSDFALPIYDADSEAEHGLPNGAQTLNALLARHQGLLIATPEHNGGYTALLKNALDWMSRPNGFPSRKFAALVSASPGLLGGVKSQLALQIVLNKLGVHVIPESFALGAAHQCFDAEGGLKDADVEREARAVGAALAQMVTRIGTGDRSLAA